jgi:hypothetical protein
MYSIPNTPMTITTMTIPTITPEIKDFIMSLLLSVGTVVCSDQVDLV